MAGRIVYRDNEAEALNRKLDYFLSRASLQPKLRADEKHVLKDEKFINSVKLARHNLGIEVDGDVLEDLEDSYGIREWLEEQLTTKNGYDSNVASKLISDAVGDVLNKSNLPSGWYDFVLVYLVLNRIPKSVNVQSDALIKVEKVEDDGILVFIEKGVSSVEYHTAWKAFKLKLSEHNPYVQTEDKLKNRIINDKKNGLSYKDLALKYFEYEYSRDVESAVSKVKKIVLRSK